MTKALEVFKIGDNSKILYSLAKYSLLIGRIMDSLSYINYLVDWTRGNIEYLMIKSYILSFNRKTMSESKMLLLKCQSLAGWEITYEEIKIIGEFKSGFRKPQLVYDENFKTWIDSSKISNEFKSTIEFNVDGWNLKNLIILKDISTSIDKALEKIEF